MPYHHLTPFERGEIQAYVNEGLSLKQIAERVRRHPSTVGREVARNSSAKGYFTKAAQRRYAQRREDCRPARKLEDPALRDYVKRCIRDAEWTPEQVANRLALAFPDAPHMRVSHETIYQAIYTRPGLGFLVAFLPQARPKRRKRGQGKTRRGPAIPNRVGIEQRPEQVETRHEPGHWEGDTIVGKDQDGFILTLVERHSRLLHAVKLATKHAAGVAHAVIAQLIERPVSWVKTLTFDNGTEFADHALMAKELPVEVYFAAPYASYQRGTNENTNGLIRRYLPKGTRFKHLSQQRLAAIVDQLNNRPRKCLGYKTPNEVFLQQRRLHQIALRA
jgi:IS30 family transposase